MNYITRIRNQGQLTHKTHPNTPRTMYQISGIMKYAEGDFDSGS